jgi:hypothetical protein
MDMELALILAIAGVVAALIALTVLGSLRQRRKQASRPARHVGERQPQRGRVFKHGTNHSKYPEW